MDGLSAVASVAGIVSLGIQVTQSLVDFYTAYKNQKSDVTHTIKSSKHLLSVLEILRNQTVDRTFVEDEQDLVKNIEGSILDCEEYIRDLQSENEKFRGGSTDNVRAVARTAAYRVTYPFRQSTLQKLDENIGEIVSHVSLALQVLGQKDICRVQSDIEGTKALLDLVRADQISSEIRMWLKAPDATINYNEASERRYTDTGLWLVRSSSFSAWLIKPNSLLWLHGFAGCGKSVLCSTIIQHTFRHRRSNPRIGIAFFFFTFNDDAKQDCSAMLCALVLQLSSQLKDNHELLLQLHGKYPGAMPADQALMSYLHHLIREFDDVYIILDALDESPWDKYRRDVLQALVDLRAWSEPGLHLSVTSREEPDIRDVLIDELGALQDETISMKNDAVDSDITSFISGSLKSDRRLRKWEKYHDQIEKALNERAKGVFRWVECQFIALDSCPRSKHHLDVLLASLPLALDKTYERMLLNIREESVEDAKRILTLLCCARRPLTKPEIVEGMAVELGDEPRLNVDRRLEDEDDIARICPGLIETDLHPGDNEPTVRIAHFSVQEYLESERIHEHAVAAFGIKRLEAHTELACICLTYLLGLVSPPSISEYPLATYAAKNWLAHYRNGDKNLYGVERQTISLFQNNGGQFENWVQIWNFDDPNGRKPNGKVQSPIYYASILGLDSVISELLHEKPSIGIFSGRVSELVDAQGGYFGNALQAASVRGYLKTVQLLLEKGADVNAQSNTFSGNALQVASGRGHEKTVQLLLEKGADLNAHSGSDFRTALESASMGGHEKIVQLLLEKGADVNAHSGSECRTALLAASDRGHEKTVQLLLENGADVNAHSGSEFRTALQAASDRGHEKTVQLLLENGADVNAHSGSDFRTALESASMGGHEKTVQLLLEKGADVNGQNKTLFRTALQVASMRGHEKIVQLLLEKGADVNMLDLYGRTALSLAVGHANIRIVKLLLAEGGVQPSLKDKLYRSPLFYAAQVGQHEMLQTLVAEEQPDPNCRDYYGSTVLSVAVRNGRRKSAEFLLSILDINVSIEDNFGRTPLWWAVKMGNSYLIELLTDIDGVKSLAVENNSPLSNNGPQRSNNSSAWCDVCMVYLRRDDPLYECDVCFNGCFCTCSDCFEVGARCLDTRHTLHLKST